MWRSLARHFIWVSLLISQTVHADGSIPLEQITPPTVDASAPVEAETPAKPLPPVPDDTKFQPVGPSAGSQLPILAVTKQPPVFTPKVRRQCSSPGPGNSLDAKLLKKLSVLVHGSLAQAEWHGKDGIFNISNGGTVIKIAQLNKANVDKLILVKFKNQLPAEAAPAPPDSAKSGWGWGSISSAASAVAQTTALQTEIASFEVAVNNAMKQGNVAFNVAQMCLEKNSTISAALVGVPGTSADGVSLSLRLTPTAGGMHGLATVNGKALDLGDLSTGATQ